jgi:hypothetical protein
VSEAIAPRNTVLGFWILVVCANMLDVGSSQPLLNADEAHNLRACNSKRHSTSQLGQPAKKKPCTSRRVISQLLIIGVLIDMLVQSSMWVKSLQLRIFDKSVLEENGLLTDRHIMAGHKLLSQQFPTLQGLQNTLYSQEVKKFKPVSGNGKMIMPIHTFMPVKILPVYLRVQQFKYFFLAMATGYVPPMMMYKECVSMIAFLVITCHQK